MLAISSSSLIVSGSAAKVKVSADPDDSTEEMNGLTAGTK